MNENCRRILVRGAGDLATGAIQKLVRAGFNVIACETERPSAIRRHVALCEAIYEREWQVEDMVGIKVDSLEICDRIFAKNHEETGLEKIYHIPIFCDPQLSRLKEIKPAILIDAIIAKKNLGTKIDMAKSTIALGPGFEAGKDAHIIIETLRGHNLGRLIFQGFAQPNTGVPGLLGGYGAERVIHAPIAGIYRGERKISDVVKKGEIIGKIDKTPVYAGLNGIIRGMIRDGYIVTKGFKIADIDARSDQKENCFTISDKARTIGGAVLEAVMLLLSSTVTKK